MTPMTPAEMLQGWSYIKTDKERFEYLRVHQDTGVVLYLDNDCMFWGIPDLEIEENTYFDSYIGWNDGALALCDAYGIKAECV